MITERKLKSLAPSTRLRKIGRLLRIAEEMLRNGDSIDWQHTSMLLRIAEEELGLAGCCPGEYESTEVTLREINHVRHGILAHLGEDPSDWDLFPPWKRSVAETETIPAAATYMRLFLDDIRAPFNVGAIFRTAAAFGVGEIVLSPGSASPDHPRAVRSAMGAVDIIPWRIASLAEVAETAGEGLFALETGGKSVTDFEFPRESTAVLGNEELGISPEVRRRVASAAGICSIRLSGPKASLNVAVAAGVLLQYWSVYGSPEVCT